MPTYEMADVTPISDRCFTIWITGMSGAGKTTLAHLLCRHIHQMGVKVAILDGDIIREHFWPELGFSKEDRDANVHRLGSLCEFFSRNSIASIVAAISPYRAGREEVRSRLRNFIEVHVQCSLSVLLTRDPKGLYKRAVRGEITGFTGISDPYEPPLSPEVTVSSDGESPEAGVEKILNVLASKRLLKVS